MDRGSSELRATHKENLFVYFISIHIFLRVVVKREKLINWRNIWRLAFSKEKKICHSYLAKYYQFKINSHSIIVIYYGYLYLITLCLTFIEYFHFCEKIYNEMKTHVLDRWHNFLKQIRILIKVWCIFKKLLS